MTLNQLINDIHLLIKTLPESERRSLVLGYSGGVDSEVLAFILSEYVKRYPDTKVKLIYVNHGLSVNAELWQQHCEKQAQKYCLPFVVKQVEVKQGARLSLESEARKVRYNAFKQEMQANDVLLTAHHKDDQLETLLLALKRGQGPKGLSSMAQLQSLGDQYWQYRPLLTWSKNDIIDFAHQNKLQHIEDESNQDTQFDRNFLRQDVIPLLKLRWPAIADTASRSALLCQQQEMLLDEITEHKLKQHLGVSIYATSVLKLESFKTLSQAWQRQILRTFIRSHHLPIPSLIQLEQAIEQLSNAKADAQIELNISGLLLRRFRNQIFIASATEKQIPKNDQVTLTEIESTVELNDGRKIVSLVKKRDQQQLRLPNEDEQISVRFEIAGSMRCFPHNRDKPRQLKKLWQELHVPPWERSRVPFIFYNETLVAAVGLWVEKSALSDGDKALEITLL